MDSENQDEKRLAPKKLHFFNFFVCISTTEIFSAEKFGKDQIEPLVTKNLEEV